MLYFGDQDRSQMVPVPTTTTTNTVLQDILDRSSAVGVCYL
jgi:hypothetical protein